MEAALEQVAVLALRDQHPLHLEAARVDGAERGLGAHELVVELALRPLEHRHCGLDRTKVGLVCGVPGGWVFCVLRRG